MALGQQQINFYGFSYGTYLGQVYATLYPDAACAGWSSTATSTRAGSGTGQPRPGRRVREEHAASGSTWVAKHDAIYHLGKTRPPSSGASTRSRPRSTASRPAASSAPTSGTTSSCPPATTSPPGRTSAALFANWVHTAPRRRRWSTSFLDTDTPGDDNGYAVYDAVQCTDAPVAEAVVDVAQGQRPGLQVRAVPDVEQRLVQRAVPHLAGQGRQPGQGQRQQGARDPAHRRDARRGDALLGQPLRCVTCSRSPGCSRSIGGTSHANSLDGNACVDNAIAAYLAHGTLPARKPGAGRSDRDCRPLPQPTAGTTFSVTGPDNASRRSPSSLGVPVRQL